MKKLIIVAILLVTNQIITDFVTASPLSSDKNLGGTVLISISILSVTAC